VIGDNMPHSNTIMRQSKTKIFLVCIMVTIILISGNVNSSMIVKENKNTIMQPSDDFNKTRLYIRVVNIFRIGIPLAFTNTVVGYGTPGNFTNILGIACITWYAGNSGWKERQISVCRPPYQSKTMIAKVYEGRANYVEIVVHILPLFEKYESASLLKFKRENPDL